MSKEIDLTENCFGYGSPKESASRNHMIVKTGMTMTEKILARASEKSLVVPGDNVWVNVDVLMTHDVCGPRAFGIFKREFGESVGNLLEIFYLVKTGMTMTKKTKTNQWLL
ncbi:unnamed protein product [Arabidopsis lyrata]|nr:unnamed protein product [Arabidopsis lyrata]